MKVNRLYAAVIAPCQGVGGIALNSGAYNARVYEPLRDSKRFVVELPRPNQD